MIAGTRDDSLKPRRQYCFKGVIGLADAFKREVIAEGVETVAHGTLLLQLGCELAQGYGIARPMPAKLPGSLLGNRMKLGLRCRGLVAFQNRSMHSVIGT
jgi:EAL domain-containing protein (putative c-di-GMP-specific phosphodiesterase class I)